MYECFQPDGDISQGNRFQVSFLVINIKCTDCTQSNDYEQTNKTIIQRLWTKNKCIDYQIRKEKTK